MSFQPPPSARRLSRRSVTFRRSAWLLVPVFTTLIVARAAAQGEPAGWPRAIESQGYVVTIYQPQTDRYEGDLLEGRAAVSVRRADGGEPVFGAVWFSARLAVDREERLVRVRQLTVPEVRFPDATDEQRQQLSRLIEEEAPTWDVTIDLDRLVADLDDGPTGATTPGLKHEPPTFVYSSEPAVLLLYDGEPVVQDVGGDTGLERVVNTPYPVVREKGGKTYYLFGGGDLWYSAGDPLGPWTVTGTVPAALKRVADGAETTEPLVEADGAAPPMIVTATEPTELIVTDGEPKWVPLEGGDLLYCENTPADVFLEVASQRYFVVVGGRWYAGRAVAGAIDWQYVPNDELPDTFADIPENSPKASVLVHVAGTVQAREEALANVIPEMAAVKRDAASPTIQYDGAPEFKPVEEATTVQYAVNTAAAVFKVGSTYYLCDNAVWYRSASPTGPWQVATEIPSVLYSVPPSNPHHNVTYVRVYDVTPQVVYVGYTPGYVGSYWSHGCIVWGTGWWYRPWYGPHYYPYPWTWGLHMTYSPWGGWGVGVSWSNGPFRITVGWRSGPYYRPPYYGGWYGPGGYRPPYRPYPPPGYRPPGYRPIPTPYTGRPGAPAQLPARPSIYARPGVSDRMAPGMSAGTRPRPAPAQLPNDVFTDRSGNVYRRTPNGGWEQRQGSQWRPADGLDRPATPSTRPATPSTGRGGATPAPQPRAGQLPTRPPGGSTPTVRPPTATPRPTQPTVRPPGGATRPQLERDARARQRGTTRSIQRPTVRPGGRGRGGGA